LASGRARGWFKTGEHAKEMGSLGGSRSTPAKARAARRNARRKRRLRALFTSRSEEWATPADTFRDLDAEFGPFTLDPCATPENAKTPTFFTRSENGLAQPWAPHRVFMNPPYGRTIGLWMAKARKEAKAGALVVALVHARTDTRWWHEHVSRADEVRFLRGRLRFGSAEASAPFPSAVVVFGPPAQEAVA
jgi:site-specific DNA-methyltransferase (adenine-specific)